MQKFRNVFHTCSKHIQVTKRLNLNRNYSVESDILNLKLHDKVYKFASVWLRDNCQCPKCFHQDSNSRIINWKTFNVNAQACNIEEKVDSIVIKWKDGHSSEFKKSWLYQRNFSSENQNEYLNNTYRFERSTWTKEKFFSILKQYDYNSILKDDNTLYNWLKTLRRFGVAIINNVPENEEAGTIVAKRVEFVKETHYGKKFFVKAKPGTTNVAYLSGTLQMHTDLPYYEYKPGVNLLHCIKQASGEGGENLLADGLYVAEFLRHKHPSTYETLANTLVDWEDIGKEGNNYFHSIYRAPVICENLDGEIIRINHSVPQRGSHFNIPIEKIKPWYEAMKMFVDMIHENAAVFKIASGSILCFDNIRLLHGREQYQDTSDNIRCVVGVYLDWDYIFSRMRTLSKE